MANDTALIPVRSEVEVLPAVRFETARVGTELPSLSEADKAFLWPQAFNEWLATKAPATQRRYVAAWEDFRAFTGKSPWHCLSTDVRTWVQELRTRPLTPAIAKGLVKAGRREDGAPGMSDATIQQMLAGVSSFYSFCEHYAVPTLDGREIVLFPGPNPAKATSIPRPQINPYDKARDFSLEEVNALLNAIQRTGRRNPAGSLRDYALFLSYLATGARNSEIRLLRWGDIEESGGRQFYRWSNKGKLGKDELPAEAWEAISEFLRVTGRLKDIRPGNYIFTALTDRATRLHQMPDGYDPRAQPLSSQEINRLLRRYCRLAGISDVGVHVHMLRHTAAMLYIELAEADVEDVQRLLHHSNLAVTSIYVRRRRGNRNKLWSLVADRLTLRA